MGRKLEDIFNECCERLLQGESIESCLERYPKEASKLEPLLKVAATVHTKAASIQARPEFKWRTRTRLEGAFLYTQRQKLAKAKVGFGWQQSWALALSIMLAVLVVGAGTAAASTQALPDEPLYPVKLVTEQARLTLTFSDIAKTELHARFAERRAEEIAQMTQQGKPINIVLATERLAAHLEKAEECACPPVAAGVPEEKALAPTPVPAPPLSTATVPQSDKAAKVKTFLEHSAARNVAALEQALQQAPEEAKPALRLAIEMTKKRYERIIKKVEEGRVSPTPQSPQDETQEPQEEEEESPSMPQLPQGKSQENKTSHTPSLPKGKSQERQPS